MNQYKYILLLISLIAFSFSNGNAQEKSTNPKNEFRAVWIATVENIDWPKKRTDSIEKEKADFIEILDTYKKLNYNAVIVQIRSVGDAFYPSELAPWSRYLTGKEGKAPSPYFDPLEWMITEAHARGFEFHAWLNPYRATMDLKTEILSPNHDFYKHPDWMIKYGGKYYYNPALPEVQTLLVSVVNEVVRNYDIDAIHFDDYFYPYKVAGEVFNDSESFAKYGNGLSLDDWRRSNVNNLVKKVSSSIKKIKPWVQFGISPFGVWRNKSIDPKGSDTQAGQTNYDDLYADPLAWMENSWIDYLVPQLYWSIDHPKASYSKLLKWWSENSKNTAIYIGNGTYKINSDSDKKWSDPNEIPNQINVTRTYKNVEGNAFFSAKSFVNKNRNVAQLLLENQYKYPALPSAVPYSKKIVIDVPTVNLISKDTDNSSFTIQYPLNSKVRYIMIYRAKINSKIDVNNPSQIIEKICLTEKCDSIKICVPTKKSDENNSCALTFIDYFGNESAATIIN
ncbi:MAG: family 10 glycosylhydrolase [Flavobacterium sp.]|uniref:glycoside hydrolase family 10 protein n=1 Tax=Flavobacterium sp. TaxID=239 RepID=UPI00261C0464|nr:family 10 glycosylhydrolase [Flavobacterium sp.]MDD5149376.1 family 10 glycosylhydrolase [Flavobacterium sp.]